MHPLSGGFTAAFPRYDCGQLFGLAADIENYPRFIPWCRAARVLRRDGDVWEVDNDFGAGPVDARFRSRAVAAPPGRLEITATDAPFRRFRLVWTFAPLTEGGSRVAVEYRMEFRSALVQVMAQLGAHDAGRQILAAFRNRARSVYGP